MLFTVSTRLTFTTLFAQRVASRFGKRRQRCLAGLAVLHLAERAARHWNRSYLLKRWVLLCAAACALALWRNTPLGELFPNLGTFPIYPSA